MQYDEREPVIEITDADRDAFYEAVLAATKPHLCQDITGMFTKTPSEELWPAWVKSLTLAQLREVREAINTAIYDKERE